MLNVITSHGMWMIKKMTIIVATYVVACRSLALFIFWAWIVTEHSTILPKNGRC